MCSYGDAHVGVGAGIVEDEPERQPASIDMIFIASAERLVAAGGY